MLLLRASHGCLKRIWHEDEGYAEDVKAIDTCLEHQYHVDHDPELLTGAIRVFPASVSFFSNEDCDLTRHDDVHYCDYEQDHTDYEAFDRSLLLWYRSLKVYQFRFEQIILNVDERIMESQHFVIVAKGQPAN